MPTHTAPRWQQILLSAGVTYTWIDELSESLIADLSPGLRVGAFICPVPGPMFTQWVNHVPCMIKANLPVYIYWPLPKDGNGHAVWDGIIRNFPFLRPYCPQPGEVPEVSISNEEYLSHDRHGRVYVVNPQNSF
ncbi:hypothetical protein BD414DRAFT_428872, partial [Trametes punicea]